MKKTLSALIALSLLLPLNGCFWNAEDTVVEEPTYAEYIGTLKSLGGVKVGKIATHMIQTEDGDVVYVYSANNDLNDSDYINKKVEVYGEVTISEDDSLEILKITTIKLAPEEQAVVDATKQSYSDQELGFSWDIMNDWQIERGAGYAIFTMPLYEVAESGTGIVVENDYIAVKIFDNLDNLGLSDWLAQYDPTAISMSSQGLIAKSLEAMAVTSEMEDTVTYYIKRTEGSVYEVSHFNYDIDHRTYFRNMFMDSLQTFTFIPFGTGYEVTDLGSSGTGTVVEDTTVPNSDEVVTATSDYDSVVAAIGSKITEIAPEEESLGGTWYVTKYEFADPNYVYVEYEDGHDMRKALLSYSTDGDFAYEVLAYFLPGTSTTWELNSGTDEAKGLQKTVVKASDGGSTVITSVLEGYSYLESAAKGFSIQYPSNWYYAASGNHYGFTDKSDGDDLVGLDILDKNLDAQTGSTVTLSNNKSAKSVTSDGNYRIYVERDDNSCFYIYGASDYATIVANMAGSITTEE